MQNDKDLSISLYKTLYLIRQSEEKIREIYKENEMKTPMHMSMGEEAVVVGVCSALSKDDQVFGTYRSHALYLSKTGDVNGFFLELYGKLNGCSMGRAGSMHLMNIEKGVMYTSAIVASSIPGAVGCAFANRYLGKNRTTCVFFGDGAVDEGCFWESLNFACLMQLPIIFVCEDNEIAVHTSLLKRRGYNDLCDIVSNFNCDVISENTTDVEVIYNISKSAIKKSIQNRPIFLNFKYYRYLEHVGIDEDFRYGYRPVSEYNVWRKLDPIALQRQRLLSLMKEPEVNEIELSIIEEIMASIFLAKKSEFSKPSDLYRDVI